jgi:alpha-galactosidase
LDLPGPPRLFFEHGWQSWSLAAWTDPRPAPIQRPAILHPLQSDPAYTGHRHPHGSWVSAVRLEDGNIVLLGSLGLDAHTELDGVQLRGWNEGPAGDWFVGYGPERAVFERYASYLGKAYGLASHRKSPRVWCSWYSLYGAIDQPILRQVFKDLSDLPFDVLQVDDGWEIAIGDWEPNPKFPTGMKDLADRIKATGRTAGLWLAPLIAVRSSRLFHEHQDWFLHEKGGRLVSAGFNWGEPVYALDTTHPEARKWLVALMKRVRAWGFDYIKLDFLYAGGLPGRRKEDLPREQAYRSGLKLMREALGKDAYLLACGAPILPSLGLCDALRVGPDVAGEWENHRDAVLLRNPTTPAVRNAIRTTLHRLWLKPLVQLDPDVAYFRRVECSLTSDQKALLKALCLICGFRSTSDLPHWLNDLERRELRTFLEAVPRVEQTGSYTFRIGGQEVDFSQAVLLPDRPRGFEALSGGALGWLANHGWALRIFDRMNRNALQKLKNKV